MLWEWKNNIILIGYMGCGKSTVGSSLAKQLDWEFLDTDAWIEEKEGVSIKEIFAIRGESYFRDLETACLQELLQEKEIRKEKNNEERFFEKKEGRILSVGGGLPVREENQKLLRELGSVIYLKANANTIYERIKEDVTRPLLQTPNPFQKIKDMLREREEKYQATAHRVITVDKKSVLELAEEIRRIVAV